MKTWQEFNDTVNDLLLVDGLRRGRGIERFKDRMIVQECSFANLLHLQQSFDP
jgi:hypothetical protein